MQRDYMLEAVQELGRILRAIMNMRKSNPSKALDEIRVAFTGTKFKDKESFDRLSASQLSAFLEEQRMDYRPLDVITDLLLEEISILLDTGDTAAVPLLMEKADLLIDYTDQQEKALKVFSLNRDVQRQRLQELRERWSSDH
jgi:hypothetical protein